MSVALKKPRVLFVTPVLGYPPRGGPQLRVYHTIRALSAVSRLTVYSLIPEQQFVEESVRHLCSLCEAIYFRDIVIAGTKPRILRALSVRRLARYRELLLKVSDLSKAIDSHVIWLEYGNISLKMLPLKALTTKPIVVDTDSVWSRFIEREAPFAKEIKQRLGIEVSAFRKRLEEFVFTNYGDVVTAVSEVDLAYYQRLALTRSDRCMLLSNVIDVDSYVAAQSQSMASEIRPGLCFSGTMSTHPNVDAAVWLLNEVMPLVWAQVPDLGVNIVGRYPSLELLDYAKQDRRVVVTGAVESIVPYLQHAPVSVVPLRFESGTRFKILEAMACRTPVVSTRLGAEGLDVEHEKDILLADTPRDFANAIVRLFFDRALCDRIRDEAFRLVCQKYDLSVAQHQVENILQKLGVVH